MPRPLHLLPVVLILVFGASSSVVVAQKPPSFKPVCGCQQSIHTLPGFRQDPLLLNEFEQQYLNQIKRQTQRSLAGVDTLPTVVHIVHDCAPLGTTENPLDATVRSILQEASLRFRHQHTGADTYSNPNYGVDTEIELVLVSEDPTGSYTTGIVRHQDPVNAVGDIATLFTSLQPYVWDTDRYHNIFVVSDLTDASGVYGGPDIEIYDANVFWSGLVAHESGHFLNLEHTFRAGCPNNNCLSSGDFVCDTPPKATSGFNGASSCSSPNNGCTTDDDDLDARNPYRPVANGGMGDQPDMITNYMDYTGSCWDAFTLGQKARMKAAIGTYRQTMVNQASQLCAAQTASNEAGVTAVGAIRMNCGDVYQAEVEITNYGINTISTLTVSGQLAGQTVSTTWSGTLTPGSSSIIALPDFAPVSSGSYRLTAFCENPNGAGDSFLNNDTACYKLNHLGNGALPPYSEDFAGCQVPATMSFENGNAVRWQVGSVSSLSACQGCAAVLTGWTNTAETARILIPNMDLSLRQNTQLTFNYGWIPRYNFVTNTMSIKVDQGCSGEQIIWSMSDLDLGTNDPPSFIGNPGRYPNCDEIHSVSLDLSAYDGLDNVQIIIEVNGEWWNPLVLDDLEVSGDVATTPCTGINHQIHDRPIVDDHYHARDTIISTGLVANPDLVGFEAGISIELNNGFEVEQGAAFSAAIAPCDATGSIALPDAPSRPRRSILQFDNPGRLSQSDGRSRGLHSVLVGRR